MNPSESLLKTRRRYSAEPVSVCTLPSVCGWDVSGHHPLGGASDGTSGFRLRRRGQHLGPFRTLAELSRKNETISKLSQNLPGNNKSSFTETSSVVKTCCNVLQRDGEILFFADLPLQE